MPRRRSAAGITSEMRNPPLTPMIDVMMCLLIVFMMLQPGLRRGLDLQLPGESLAGVQEKGPDQIVLYVLPGEHYAINQDSVKPADLVPQLRAIYAQRARKVLFVKGDSASTYAEVIHAVDLAREAGIEVVGLVPGKSP